MQNPLLSALMSLAAVAGVASATQAISLSNFTPRIENLPSLCSQAYTSTIEGCQASDFSSNVRCSAQCVQGLVRIADLVSRQCANVDVPETSIIGVFMLGAGVPAVCPGVVVTTIGRSSTQAAYPTEAPEQTTTEAEASSTAESSSTRTPATLGPDPTTSASSTSSSSESSVASSSTSTSTEAAATTTATQPQITFDTSAMAAPPAPTNTAAPQRSNQDSGGGSPFDVQASNAATPLRLGRLATTAVLGLAALVVVFL